MRNGRVLGAVSLAVALVLFTSPSRPARADNVVADDQIVQGNLCVGTQCADGELFLVGGGEIKVRGTAPLILFEDTDGRAWEIFAVDTGFSIVDATAINIPFKIFPSAPSFAFLIAEDGKVGVGTEFPSQPLHVRKDQNANTFFLVQNGTNGLNANAVVRTQADVAVQNFQSHASSRTLVRWGVPLGGWNEFLSVVGNGLAMGTLGNAPFVLGTSSTAQMTLFGDSNVIAFGGGGVYNGANFLDASSRARKQDVEPLEREAAVEALAGLAPVRFEYRDAPGDARVGFIAEDVPDLVARPGRATLSALEIVAVLTKVVQEQQTTMREQQRVAEEHQRRLEAQITELMASHAELAAKVRALEPKP